MIISNGILTWHCGVITSPHDHLHMRTTEIESSAFMALKNTDKAKKRTADAQTLTALKSVPLMRKRNAFGYIAF